MEENEIVENFDQKLFSEDLNNFVFRQHDDEFPRYGVYARCRGYRVHEGFNETVKNAVDIIQRNSVQGIEAVFSVMSLEDDITKEYQDYASHLWRRWKSRRFDGEKYLHYCVLISCLGERFYREGFLEFDFLAYEAVRKALERFDMLNGGWNSLNLEASIITSMEQHFQSLPSPDRENGIRSFLLERFQALTEHSREEHEDMSDFEGSSRNLENNDYLESSSESDMIYEDHSESVSSDESSSERLISMSPEPIQSNVISSTITCQEFATPKEISYRGNGHYYYRYIAGLNSQYLYHNFVNKMPLDISVNSERNSRNESASISTTRSNDCESEHMILPHIFPQKRDVDEINESSRQENATPKEISFQGNGYYYYKYTVAPNSSCLHHNAGNEVSLDLSKDSDRNSRNESASISTTRSIEYGSEHLIPPYTLPQKRDVDENNETIQEEIATPKEISFHGNEDYRNRYTVAPNSPCLRHNFVNEVPLDLSEESEWNSRSESQSISLLHSNEHRPHHLILPHTLPEKQDVDENSETATEKVDIPREHTFGLERNRNDKNEIVQDLLQDHNSFHFQKLCSESRRTAKGHPLLTGLPASNSAAGRAGTSLVSQISDNSENSTTESSNTNLEQQTSGKIFTSPHNSAKNKL